MGERTSLRKCTRPLMRSALLAKISCARVCPYKSVGRSFETNLGIRLQTRRCDYSFVLGAAVRTSVGTLNPSSCGKAGARERFQAFSELLLTSSAQQRLKGADHRISRFLGSDSDDFRSKAKETETPLGGGENGAAAFA